MQPNFQSIIYVVIIRTKDGMPLSSSTDFTDEINRNIKECKRYIKLLSKKAQYYPERCILRLPSHTIHFISYQGVTCLSLCSSTYPNVLAFSLLNEIMKEFLTIHNKIDITNVVRPYSFLEFDNVIHKTCQRYNKPQNLTTRINLSDLSFEIKSRPPHVIKLEEIDPVGIKNGFVYDSSSPYSVSQKLKFENLTFLALFSMMISVLLSLVSIFRGISIFNELSFYEEFGNEAILHCIVFLTDSILRFFQIILLLHQMKYRKLKSWILFICLCMVCFCISELRDKWQNYFFLFSVILMQFCILRRQIQKKLPDYQV